MRSMKSFRIALANVRAGGSPDEAVAIAKRAIAEAGEAGAGIVCFPECYVPGYRGPGKTVPPPDEAFLDRAWTEIAGAARTARIAVILGTERIGARGVMACALVIQPDGTRDGFQDKVQIDPSEDDVYVAGSGRRVFK